MLNKTIDTQTCKQCPQTEKRIRGIEFPRTHTLTEALSSRDRNSMNIYNDISQAELDGSSTVAHGFLHTDDVTHVGHARNAVSYMTSPQDSELSKRGCFLCVPIM